MLNELAGISTVVIAVATVAYVVVTVFLWRVTKNSADAAKTAADAAALSAQAAKKSADIDAALHRPYLGVSELRRHNDWNADSWAIRCSVKNYGTLPASKVKIDIAIGQQPSGTSYGAGPICDNAEVFPQAELGGFLNIGVDKRTHGRLSQGDPMVAEVTINYFGPKEARYTHIARFSYDMRTQNFRVDDSETSGSRS